MLLQMTKRLREQGVLGINQRNCDFILRYNERRLYPLVDDKLKTKKLAMRAGMAVPELYGVVRNQHDAVRLGELLKGRDSFVVKPAHGSGGDGIMVIAGRRKDCYRTVSGTLVTHGELVHHVSNTLSGQYSLGGNADQVIIEYCVRFDPLFDALSFEGVPDIRVIVFCGVPVMAMMRFPTRMSHGKANLHQGAIGAGVDLITGKTMRGVVKNHIVEEHPDTGVRIDGLHIPGWDNILRLASRCYELTGLGYLGVDIVIDCNKGPLILELNARPGLNIQLANFCGLARRLARVEQAGLDAAGVEEWVRFATEDLL